MREPSPKRAIPTGLASSCSSKCWLAPNAAVFRGVRTDFEWPNLPLFLLLFRSTELPLLLNKFAAAYDRVFRLLLPDRSSCNLWLQLVMGRDRLLQCRNLSNRQFCAGCW